MQVVVKSRNIDLPQRLKDEAVKKLSKVRRLFSRFIDMEVVFSEDHNPRIADRIHCEVVLHGKGRTIRAEASAPDVLSAIDAVQERLTRQVATFKEKRISRLHRRFGLRQAVIADGGGGVVEDTEAS